MGVCDECGETHDELEPAFHRPDAVFAVPEDERDERVEESDDVVVIDQATFFIRGVVRMPVHGRPNDYGWGFWVRLSEEDFREYLRYDDEDPPDEHPGFLATLANQAAWLP